MSTDANAHTRTHPTGQLPIFFWVPCCIISIRVVELRALTHDLSPVTPSPHRNTPQVASTNLGVGSHVGNPSGDLRWLFFTQEVLELLLSL